MFYFFIVVVTPILTDSLLLTLGLYKIIQFFAFRILIIFSDDGLL